MKSKIVSSCIVLLCFSQVLLAQNYGNWLNVDTMQYKRREHTSILLPNGNVLVTGGVNNGKSCEIFNIVTKEWETAPAFNFARSFHNLIKLTDGRIMAVGGFNENTIEILAADASHWIAADTFTTKRYFGQSTIVLDNNNVLLIGGALANTISNDCQVFDVAKMKWRTTDKLGVQRYFHATTKLLDGRILVTGGYSGGSFTNTCEIYDPRLEKWTLTDTMKEARAHHAAVPLKDGRVLVFGGYGKTTELFDPTTNKWITVGNASAAEVRWASINNEAYILYVDGPTKYSCGWGIISLKDFSRKYFKLFGDWIYGQTLTKIDENRVLITGGYEVKGDGTYYISINKSSLYDYTLTGIEIDAYPETAIYELIAEAYPNPFNSITNIMVNSPVNTNAKVELYNVLGEKLLEIFNGRFTTGLNKFNVESNNLSSGVYFILVKTEKKISQIKIIHQK